MNKRLNIKNEIKTIFSNSNEIDWRNSQIVFSLIVQLLIYDKYRFIIWLNCLITSGELSNASQSLYTYLMTNKTNHYLINLLLNDLEKIFSDKQYLQVRIIVPCIQALERLLSQSTFENYYEKNSKEFIQYWIKLIHLFEDIFIKKIKFLIIIQHYIYILLNYIVHYYNLIIFI